MKKRNLPYVCKKTISTLLAITIFFGYPAFSSTVCAAETNNNRPELLSASRTTQASLQYESVKGGICVSGYTGNPEIVEIPGQIDGQTVISIGYGAFEDCKTLTQVIIPEGVTAIAGNAFDGCSSLMRVTIPSTITEFSVDFLKCTSLENFEVAAANESYASEDGVLFNKDKSTLLQCPCAKKGQYTIPATVKTIDFMAFRLSNLTEIVIPEGVTSVGNYAFSASSIESISLPDSLTKISSGMFSGCQNLKTIHIPKGVSKISSDVFSDCDNIESFTVSAENPYLTAIEGVIYNKAKTKVIQCPPKKEGSYTIPDTVTSIGAYAFAYCSELTEISLPSKLTAISDAAFMYCSGLTDVTIPANVGSIGDSAFSGCANIETVAFNKNTKSIDGYAFSGCKKLKSVTLPQNLTSIKMTAFQRCTALTNIEIGPANTNYTSNDGVLYNKDMTKLIICPNGKTDNLTLPEGITSLLPENNGALTFEILDGCQISSITLPSTYSGFSDSIYRFGGCAALEEVNISENHEKFRSVDGVVYDKNVEKLIMCPRGRKQPYQMPDTVTSINKYAFYNCKNLSDVTISKNVASINYNNFYGCTIDTVLIPEGVSKIAGYAFEGCTIKKLCIANSVTDISKTSYGYIYDYSDIADKKMENLPIICCEKGSYAYNDAKEKGFTIDLPVSIKIKDYQPDKKYDSLAVEQPKNSQLIINSAEYEEITFTWYRNSVAETNKLETAPVNTGTYILVISLGENEERKETSIQKTVKISKAGQPPTMPEADIQAGSASKKVKDVPLPKNWVWLSQDMEKPLQAGIKVTAKAEYSGSDKGNYEKETVEVSITRLSNPSEHNLKKGQTFTDKKSNAVYTVTKIGQKNGCVAYTKLKNKKAKSASIPGTVTINGVSYKVTSVSANAFSNNKKITGISIGSNVITIGNKAFYGCTSLRKVTIPVKVSKIGKQAFYGCRNLKTINIKTAKLTRKNIGSRAFQKTNTKITIKVPKRKLADYKKILRTKGISTKAKIKK